MCLLPDFGAVEFVGFIEQDECGGMPDELEECEIVFAESAAGVGDQHDAADFGILEEPGDIFAPEGLGGLRRFGVAVAGQIGEEVSAAELEEINHARASGGFGGAGESSAAEGVEDAGFTGVGASGEDGDSRAGRGFSGGPSGAEKCGVVKIHRRRVLLVF